MILAMVICDGTTLFWGTMSHAHKKINQEMLYVFWWLNQLAISPSLSLSPRPPNSLRHNNIEIKPINKPTMASKHSSERKSPIPHLSL